jgi:hypothetical protein
MNNKYIIQGSQQELERLHKALSLVISTPGAQQRQVIEENFNVIFRKQEMLDSQQGALDEVDDGN